MHGSLYILQVQAGVHNMGAVQKKREEISPGESSQRRIGAVAKNGANEPWRSQATSG
jgi:hypothetical protein